MVSSQARLAVFGVALHALLIYAMFDVHFLTPLVHGMEPTTADFAAPASRLRRALDAVSHKSLRAFAWALTLAGFKRAGATLALALVFLKSNNASVAAQFRVPTSTYELHCVRPGLVGGAVHRHVQPDGRGHDAAADPPGALWVSLLRG